MIKLFKNKSKFTVITILFCIFMLFYLCTVAYSAFSSTINISGMAHARIDTDIRITDFSLYNVSDDSISSYEEFSKDSVLFNIDFENDSSYVIYKVEVTNYGSREMGILEISGLQSNLSYELIDYSLKDKICNNSGVCSGLVKKEIYLKIYQTSNVYTNKSVDVNLYFEFRPYIKVSYENLNYSNYPLELLYGDSLDIDITKDNPSIKGVEVVCVDDVIFSYNDGKLRIPFVENDLVIKGGSFSKTYSYTGSYETFTAPYPGIYKVELWGGSGGYYSSAGNNGRGGYTSGEIMLNAGDKFYVYVGGKGGAISGNSGAAGGFNGGGKCTTDCGGGGGATDLRIVSGNWNDFNSLKSRIMVAAGGAGENYYSSPGNKKGGSAGGLEGYLAYSRNNSAIYILGGTQTNGASAIKDTGDDSSLGGSGSFGIGGAGGLYGGGGGAGYYGGAGGANQPKVSGVSDSGGEISGSGGSSFISGHEGCNAIKSESTSSNIIHTGEEIHYSKYNFENTVMIDGDGYSWTTVKGSSVVGMPNFNSNGTMTGNNDNGYAKISLISMYQELEADIKITNFYKDSSNNASSLGERMTDSSISADVSLPDASSYIIYKVEVTNYGSRKMGISNISGLPSNLSYELIDYNLKDMICNQESKCNWGASKDVYIKIKYNSFNSNKTSYHVDLAFDFKPFYEITYKNINKSSLVYNVFSNETLNVNIGYDVAPGVKFLRNGVLDDEFKYVDGNLSATNVLSDIMIEGFSVNSEYNYTGNYQTFAVPVNGLYKIELWGAAGGHLSSTSNNGKGGYTSGEIVLNGNAQLYVYVGGKGASTSEPKGGAAGGWNGGGNCTSECGGGGGATDVRLTSGSWNNTSSLRSRIMVAAGGAGENNYTTTGELRGGSAGGLIGYDAYSRHNQLVVVPGATQIKGGITPTGSCDGTALGANGSFGVGGAAGWYGGGGGSGYYGGAGGANQPKTATASDEGGEVSGSGGSSFISGHNGCDAINSSGAHTGQSIHYSNYKFTNTKMIDGQGYNWTNTKGTTIIGMPNFNGNGTMNGNNSTGYAKIRLIGMIKE